MTRDARIAEGKSGSVWGHTTTGHTTDRCYAEANGKLEFSGAELAESAPVHPVEVGKQIKDHWTVTYWPGRKRRAIDALARELVASGRAKKTKPTATRDPPSAASGQMWAMRVK